MEIEKIVGDAWFKTVEVFKNTGKSGEARLWTEATLRLNFLRHLCEIARLGRILAETSYHWGDDDYKPDIVVDVMINSDTKRVAFEMKFFGQAENWKKDLKRLQKYSLVGWDYGYFLAIGRPQQCDEIQKEPIEELPARYKIKILTHPTPGVRFVPDFKFAELVLKESLEKDIPYVVNEFYGAGVLYEKYALFFDMSAKENKIVIWAELTDKLPEEQKIKELGYAYITFDEEGKMHPSVAFTGDLLVGEFELVRGTTVGKVVKKTKAPLNRFKEKIDLLYES